MTTNTETKFSDLQAGDQIMYGGHVAFVVQVWPIEDSYSRQINDYGVKLRDHVGTIQVSKWDTCTKVSK